MSEERLAASVVAALERQGWTVYQEVQYPKARGRADVVAVKGSLLHVIEVKVAFGFKVLDQAHRWLGVANLVSVATEPTRLSHVRERVCEHLGVGWYVAEWGEDLTERVAPRLFRRAAPGLRAALRPGHQTSARAGTNGAYWSDWRATCGRLAALIVAEPGLTMNEAVKKITHHYSTERSAAAALTRNVETGAVPSVVFREVGPGRRRGLYSVGGPAAGP